MKIITLDQRSPAWHEYRKHGLGSSDISSIMGLNPYKSAIDVYNEKHNGGSSYTNSAMQRGVKYETEALSWASNMLKQDLLPLCIENIEHPWMRASLDGYSKEGNFIVEIKVPTEKNFETQCREIDPMHHCQVQWQLLVSGCDHAYLTVYSPERKEGVLKAIQANEDYQYTMFTICQDFWFNNVLKQVIPEEKDRNPEIFDLNALKLSQKLEETCNSIKFLETMRDTLKEDLFKYNPGRDFKIGNFTIKLCKGKVTLDKEALKKDGLDLSKYEVKGTDYWKWELKK